MKVIIKLTLAAMLFALWANKFVDYIQFMTISLLVGFLWLTYKEFREERLILAVLSFLVVIYLNPIYDFSYSAYVKNKAYLVLAIGLIITSIADLFTPKQQDDN